MQGPDSAPGPSGFRNLEPRTRDERNTARNKDALEKARIEARSTNPYNRKHQPLIGNPVVPHKGSPMYCDEADRFQRDVAGELHRQKQEALQRKEDVYSAKRVQQYNMQKDKYDRELAATSRSEATHSTMRATGEGGSRKGKSGENYNIITLNYNNTPAGQELLYKDEQLKYKGQMRAIELYGRSHSVPHNIITGEPLQLPVPQPARPVAPWER